MIKHIIKDSSYGLPILIFHILLNYSIYYKTTLIINRNLLICPNSVCNFICELYVLHVAILLSAFLGYNAEENVSKEGLRLSMPLQAACTQKLKLSTVVDI